VIGASQQISLLSYVHRLTASAEALALPDEELLRRFAQKRDESAFAVLVRRHGPMVLAACRRQLRADDVEDAFQATFLVLARRAGAVAQPERLGPWLYGVAFRVARQARRQAARGTLLESPEALAAPADDPCLGEMGAILDEELAALPERHRAVLVLCCLQGVSREEAAARLKLSPGAVKGLLERGRERLRERLTRRGLAAYVIPPVIPGPALPERLAAATIQTMRGASASGSVAALAEGVLRSMNLLRWQTWLSLAAVALLCAGTALAMQRDNAPQPIALRPAAEQTAQDKAEPEPKKSATEIDLKTPINALVWAGDKQLAVGGNNGDVRLWDLKSGKVTKLVGLQKPVRALAATADGTTMASADADGLILWDLETSKPKWSSTTKTAITSLALSPDGKALACADDSNQVVIREVESGKLLAMTRLDELKAAVRSVAYSPDGKRLLVGILVTLNEGSFWNELKALDAKTGKVLAKTAEPGGKDDKRARASAHRVPVTTSPDGKWYAAAAWDDTILTSSPFVSYSTKARGITGVAYLADSSTLAVAARDGTVRLVNPKKVTGDEDKKAAAENARAGDVAVLKGQGQIVALALSPDGKALAWANAAGKVKLIAVAKLRKDHAIEQKK
jgi:RNA polymerase sigma factor (sigma-70 family)